MGVNRIGMVAALRLRLNALFPRAAGFRTDYARSDDGASRRALVIESFDTRPIYVVVSEYANARSRSISQLKGRFQMSDEVASEALEVANTLAEINDYAAWPARVDAKPVRIATPDSIAGSDYSDFPGMGGHFRRLRGLLEKTNRIQVTSATGKSGASTRTKEWLVFYRPDGTVLSELALNLITPAVREYYTATDSASRQLAESRLARWTQQLDASFREVLAAIPEIEVLTGIAAINEVHFER